MLKTIGNPSVVAGVLPWAVAFLSYGLAFAALWH